jgi:hypothetical protein
MVGGRPAVSGTEMTMRLEEYVIAMALVGALSLTGCGRPQSETPPAAGEPADPATAGVPQPATPAEPAAPTEAARQEVTAGGEFTKNALASPFAEADMALSESYNSALIACQIGDYASAATTLDGLAARPDLTPAQRQAIKDLLAQVLKAAPELASRPATTADAGQPQAPPQFPVVVPDGAESPKNPLDNAFSTADAATSKSFTRAKAAFNIGDYDTAQTVLKDLASNPQLNFQQKYAVQSMLDKIPQTAPAAPAKPSAPAINR